MIGYISRTDTVLTEHIGDLGLSQLERGRSHDAAIYEQDTAWLRECDMLIAECTTPSLGVGYELAYAEMLGKPCYVFYNRVVSQLSAMLTGDPFFRIHPYESESEIYPLLDDILSGSES